MILRLSIPCLLCCLVPLLCTCDRAPKTLFQERLDTGINSTNQLHETENWNIIEYLYFYNGGGVAATDINGDGLPDLYFTNNQGPNKYYVNEGNFKFRDATEEGAVAGAGDWSTGISVVDVNADGRMDLYVCNVSGYKGLKGRNELFLQNEDGSFTEAAAAYGLDFGGFNTQAYWFDYDQDGDLDLYLLRHSVHDDATYGTAADRYTPDSLAGDLLLRNDLARPASSGNAAGKFTNVTEAAGILSSKIGYGLSVAIADFDQDSLPDIYVCNDFRENDYYYLNNGDGTFRESVRALTGHTSNFSMGAEVADFDQDRWPDLLTLDMAPATEAVLKTTVSAETHQTYTQKRKQGFHHQYPRNALQWNRGQGNFSEVAALAGVSATDWSWSCLVEDFDLDGRQDIFVANGIERRPNSLDYLKYLSTDLARTAPNLAVIASMPSGSVKNRAFRNTGDWSFAEVGREWGLDLQGSSTGAAVADFDQDGDADLVLNNLNAPATIYENRQAPRPRSVGSTFNPTSSPLPRYDPDTRLCPQRGMMSQSQGRYGPDRGTAPRFPPQFTVRATGINRTAAVGDFFDRDPLAPYKPKPGNEPVLRLQNGDYAIAADEEGWKYEVVRWQHDTLTSLGQEVWPALKHQMVNDQQTVTLRLPLTPDGEGIFAQPFGGIGMMLRGGKEVAVAGARTGIWQSLNRLTGNGGPGTTLLAGNWGLNSGLLTPTPEEPVRLYLAKGAAAGDAIPLLTYVRQGKEVTVADKDELAASIPALQRVSSSYTDFANRTFGELFPDVVEPPQVVNTLQHLLLQRKNGGNWTVDTLPRAAQITTINCALRLPQGVLLGGNLWPVQPRIGRQDAAALQLWEDDGTVTFIDLGGARNRWEVRDMVLLDDQHVLLVIGHGEHLVLGW